VTATSAGPSGPTEADPWWRSAVIYQVYIRSFADGDGDGLGDIAGLRARLGHLARLGVDALWITPWYPSPMHDGGYDISDHRGIEPLFGTLDDAQGLLDDAHARGLRVLLDLVPNHTSSDHRWFQEALAAGPGSAERARYLFRPGVGDGPPNDWRSQFGGPAWTRVSGPDGRPGEWYLHLFAPEQPDLNWDNPEVRTDFETTLRFWFDRGVDGFRIDVANSLVKADGLPDVAAHVGGDHPHWDRDEVHHVYRRWRAIADSYAEPRVFVAEAWVERPDRLARYVRADELHTAFNFEFLTAPWLAPTLRRVIDTTVAAHAAVGAPPTWVLSNHDVARTVSRYARTPGDHPTRYLRDLLGREADGVAGVRRARAAALLMFALPGGAYVYQGEELGLPEVEDLPDDRRQDPIWTRSAGADPGRDGCRVPLPWSGSAPPFGFSPDGASAPPWLPQPADWAGLTVAALDADPGSVLALYRRALTLRRSLPALGDGTLRWLDAPPGCLCFARDPDFVCLVNLSDAPVPGAAGPGGAAAGLTAVLASAPLEAAGAVPPDVAVWYSRSPGPDPGERP